MKNKKINQFLSLILAVFMVLSMLPMNAYSIDTGVGENEGLEDLLIYTGSNASSMQSTAILGKANSDYPDRELFEQEKTKYVLEESDSIINASLRFAVVTKEEGSTVKVVYSDTVTDSAIKELKPVTSVTTHTGTNWARCITKPGKNTFSIVVTTPAESSNKEVVYEFTVYTKPSLTALEIYDGSNKLYLDKDFKSDLTTYSILVSENTNYITFYATKNDNYQITFNGETNPEVNIEEKNKVEIDVSIGEGSDERSTKYTVNLNKVETYSATINVNPNDAIYYIYDSYGSLLSKNIEGKYSDLLSGEKYTYVVTKYGYVSETGTFMGNEDLNDGILNVTLEEAAVPAIPLPSYSGDWTSFRGNPENMGIINADTPTSIESAMLKWAVKYGTGWSAAPTPPLILNDALYIAVSDKILKIDKTTGEKIQESEALEANVGYALNPITYGNGMFFVPIGQGRVQALRADTLESLWVSENLGTKAQTVSPLIYHEGYVYTGVWNNETEIGTYFCLSVTDEDLEKKIETKLHSWKLNHLGGFYWAGAYVTDNYLIVGSDDGSPANNYTDTAVLYSINPKTGAVLDTIDRITGDIRSSVSFDKTSNKAFFATKGGLFCTVKVNDDGTFDNNTFKTLDLGGMCTGTPLVYKDRAYIGSSSGNNQFGPGKLNVIDLSKESPELAYTAELPGYPQASALLSTAYGDTAYVYITYNNQPGGIYVIEDEIGQTSANGYDLFIPDEAQKQYSISSLVADRDGTIYYKNDSCYLMAVENNVSSPNTVTVAAYDYTAADAGLSGASSNGEILEKSVELTDGMTAKEAILSAFNEAGIDIVIQDTMYGPYISSVNNLAAGTGGGMSGWLLNYNNDDFSNLGLDTIELKSGDRLALHYSVNPDSSTDDVGNGWYGLPIVDSFTLKGQKVVMSKETSYDEDFNTVTTYYIHGQRGAKERMQGDGTEGKPFIIPITLPNKTDLSALTAEYTTSLNPHYRIVTGLDGEQNYTNGLSFSINTMGGKYKTYYKVLVKIDGGSPGTPNKSYITLSIDKKTINKGYVLSPAKFEIKKGESVWDVLERVLDDEGIDYDYSNYIKYNSVYVESIDGDGEFDHGSGSGWMYNVNGWYPNYGASLYELEDGDVIQWRYTTNLGVDLGEDITKWDPKIIISGIKDKDEVTESQIIVTITAGNGNGKIIPTVQLNGEKVNGSNGKYTLKLKEGTNKLIITAKDSMDNLATEELQIIYVTGGGSTGAGGQNNSSATPGGSSPTSSQIKYNDEEMMSSWAKDSINRATKLGIVQGYNNLFNPQSNITRAEFTKIIVGVLNLDITAEKSNDFADVSLNDWFYPYINAAYKANIVAGAGNDFKPNDHINREQMAVIVVRALGLKDEYSKSALKDLNLISDWARADVEKAISYGLMLGDNDNFNPKSFATREMAAVVAMRAYDYINSAGK